MSEIAEELFEDKDAKDEQGEKMPLLGNSIYVVTMKLKKDLLNWVHMYGCKVCLDYRGIKKQCSACFGGHIRKYCKNEKMSIGEYADRFKLKNPNIPEHLYGKFYKMENVVEQAAAAAANTTASRQR